ncbi:MAG: glycosyltransferase family 4 protein [Thermoguttaceae bacterium]|nr:glycosyltransferase family 4 protein [Thermoguttaceae bacterium]
MFASFVQYDAQPGGSPISGLMVVNALRNTGWRVEAVFAAPGPMTSQYEELGCRVHVLPHGQWLGGGTASRRVRRWGRDLKAAAGFVRLMRQLRPELVYINTLTGFAAAAAARWLRIPAVWHVRELFDDVGGEMHPPFGGMNLARMLVTRLPERIVVNSRAVAENVLGTAEHPKLTIVPNAVPDRFFQLHAAPEECRRRLGLPLGVPVLGVPGTLRPMKGHPWFLEAAVRVAAAAPACHFAFCGDGTAAYRQELNEQVKRLGLEERVHFVGTVADMRDFYGASDIACVPSRAEPFGRVVVEAFAVGVPVIASAIGGIREIVDDGVTGLLVKYGDVEGLAAAMFRLLYDAGLRQRLATQARRDAEDRYRQQVYADRILAVIDGLTAG